MEKSRRVQCSWLLYQVQLPMRFALFVVVVLFASCVFAQSDREMSKRQEQSWKHLSAFYFKIGIRSNYRPDHTYFYVGMIDRLHRMISSDLAGFVKVHNLETPLGASGFLKAQRDIEWMSRLFTATTNQPFIQVEESRILDLFPPPVPMERRIARAWTMQFVQVSFIMMFRESGIVSRFEIHHETPGTSFAEGILASVFSFDLQQVRKSPKGRIIKYIAEAGTEANAFLQHVYQDQGMRFPKQRVPKFVRRHLS